MREEFLAIVSGWTLIDGLDDLTDRISAAATWTRANGPLQPDESATIDLMIRAQIARGMPELIRALGLEREYGLPPDPDDNDAACPPDEHKWIRQRVGGAPDDAASLDVVEYCSECGVEQTDPFYGDSSMVRCKFKCESIEPVNGVVDNPARVVTLNAQWEPKIPEDERFTTQTPTGKLVAQINNPRALAMLKVGGLYYLDLTAVEAAT